MCRPLPEKAAVSVVVHRDWKEFGRHKVRRAIVPLSGYPFRIAFGERSSCENQSCERVELIKRTHFLSIAAAPCIDNLPQMPTINNCGSFAPRRGVQPLRAIYHKRLDDPG